MIASLPMYDRPETAAANDRLWELVRDHYHAWERGVLEKQDDALRHPPETLTRAEDLWDQWQHPSLFLSQTCGLPYRAHLHGKVTMIGVADHKLPGTKAGFYYSVLVARKKDKRSEISNFDQSVIAINDPLSQSGWAAPYTYATGYDIGFARKVTTGSHVASARAVAEGGADIAALDAVTWTMISRWDAFADDLKIIGQTNPTPALPYISARGFNTGEIVAALQLAIRDLSNDDKDTLCLYDLSFVHPDRYLALPVPPAP